MPAPAAALNHSTEITAPTPPASAAWAFDWKVILGGVVFLGLTGAVVVVVLQIMGAL
jgi:hypothetical protein